LIFLVKALTKFVCALPLSVSILLGRFLGFIFGHVIRYHRKEALEQCAMAFPEKSPKEIKRIINTMYKYLGLNVVESIRLSNYKDSYGEKYFEVTGYEHVEKELAEGNGVIALMGHVGNWECIGLLGPLKGAECSIIVKKIKPPELNDYLVHCRSKIGLNVIPRDNAFRPALKTLRENKVAGFILDQNVIEREGIFVDFFGKEACTTAGCALLAKKTGAKVLPFWDIRKSNRHHEIRICPPLEVPDWEDENAVHDFTQLCTKQIEDFIREYPEQWIWIHKRWKTKRTK